MKDLMMIYDNCMSKLDDLRIKPGVIKEVKVNSRAKTRLGRCTRRETVYGFMYIIEISSELLADEIADSSVEQTMLHELLHTCDGCMNHGPKWKRLASQVNQAFGYNIERTSNADALGVSGRRVHAKHKIVCTKCGASVYRMRESKITKHPEWYRCSCGGNLIKEY